jgi:hypothetical protein
MLRPCGTATWESTTAICSAVIRSRYSSGLIGLLWVLAGGQNGADSLEPKRASKEA